MNNEQKYGFSYTLNGSTTYKNILLDTIERGEIMNYFIMLESSSIFYLFDIFLKEKLVGNFTPNSTKEEKKWK